MQRLLHFAICAALVGWFASPVAANELNYSYIEGGYLDTDLDDLDVDGDGFGVSGSIELTEDYFLVASIASQEATAGATVLIGYLIGLGAIQYLIAITAGWAAEKLLGATEALRNGQCPPDLRAFVGEILAGRAG